MTTENRPEGGRPTRSEAAPVVPATPPFSTAAAASLRVGLRPPGVSSRDIGH